MKNKSLYLIIIVILVGLFIPKSVLAKNMYYNTIVDYQFYVKDQENNDVENLKFIIHDTTNTISYESSYDSNSKVYSISNRDQINNNSDSSEERQIIPNEWLPNEFINDLNNLNTDSYEEYNRGMQELINKYNYVDMGTYPGGTVAFLKVYIPMILEETNNNENPIKKFFYAEMHLYSINNNSYGFTLALYNNSCNLIKANPNNPYIGTVFNEYYRPTEFLIRNSVDDYNEDKLQKYLNYNFSSIETNNKYQNICIKKIASSEISSAETSSEEINVNSTKESREEINITHHSVVSTALTRSDIAMFARLTGTELITIGDDTTEADLQKFFMK